jgi:1,4-alpha-glucan branching enzyme
MTLTASFFQEDNMILQPGLTRPVTIQQLSSAYITEQTPMGGHLLPSGIGATFRVWAPAAREVQVLWDYTKEADGTWAPRQAGQLTRMDGGRWAGFVPGLRHGDRYLFYIVGPAGGTVGPKRDPFARDLTDDPMWPDCQCLLYDPTSFSWHDQRWKPPMFHELVIYQLHIGTWYIPVGRGAGTFLDIIDRLPYLKALGINAIQLLPIVEFPTMFSLGYNGVDYFSPETDYGIKADDPDLPDYLARVNELMHKVDPTLRPYEKEHIIGGANQFRMMVDMCHVYGLAVLLDVVYNHAGGDFDDRSIYFFDRQPEGNHNNSLYFTDHGWAGGLVFAYWNNDVKQFLIDNALFYLQECHADGFRYDEVSVIKNEGGEHGWRFCQYVTDTGHHVKPEAIHIAEHWPVEQAIVAPTSQGGAGFDALQTDGLRDAIRDALRHASDDALSFVDMDRVARELVSPVLSSPWRAVQCVENHDLVLKGRDQRIPRLADGANARSWYARSRSRVAMGLMLTAVGIPHVFMGQEILEDKQWHDEPGSPHQIWWEGLEYDKVMLDFFRFTRELLAVRTQLPALISTEINVYHVHNANRIVAFHRWLAGKGQDVVVVASLNETTFWDYELGFPVHGYWREAFNSDVYDGWVNPWVAGNGGGIQSEGRALHGLPTSARIVIPANSVLLFAR